ncbi:glycoside hydrolase family 30 beta sandwich domain-containing protein [Chitinophaga sp.]|uniref:glycoside hydrolase family 30 protein n=1 Tax=Chitinophaga sp. TaxID=1869181 RepID=UPI0031D87257
MKKWLYAGCVASVLAGCAQKKENAAVYLTTADEKQLFQPQTALEQAKDTALINVKVDTSLQYQEIEGFGAAMTGSSAYVMQQYMTAPKRKALLNELFDADKGIGINYIRLSIGASDFSVSPYSYDDMPAGERDDSLQHFSLAKDTGALIPVLKEVVAINPSIHIMATPWSAPGWMKTSDKLEGGSLRPDVYSAYAQYFAKYIQAMDNYGIKVTSLSVQNEPQYEAAYPTMKMTAPEQLTFIKDHLGPVLQQKGIKTEILLFDHNWNSPEYPISILSDSVAGKYVAGAAFHCYEGSVGAMSQVHDAYPDKGLYFTECSGGSWAPDFAGNLKYMVGNLMIGTVNNWSRNVLLWNMALDEHNGPTTNQPGPAGEKVNRGCMTCRGVVTVKSDSGAVVKNVEYYALAHFSKFVRPGAKRIASSHPEGLENVAFLNKDGSRVLVALNTEDKAKVFSVQDGSRVYQYELKPGGVVTLAWK